MTMTDDRMALLDLIEKGADAVREMLSCPATSNTATVLIVALHCLLLDHHDQMLAATAGKLRPCTNYAQRSTASG